MNLEGGGGGRHSSLYEHLKHAKKECEERDRDKEKETERKAVFNTSFNLGTH